MTKKDYESIAKVLRNVMDYKDFGEDVVLQKHVWTIAGALAQEFQKNTSNFDKVKFYKAIARE